MARLDAYVAVAAAALLAAIAIAAAAEWDYHHPAPSTHAEWVAAWYCTHLRERCDEAKPWHEGWHRRERYYTLGFSGSLTLAALFGIAVVGRARLGT